MYYRKKRRRWRNNPNGVLTETIKCGMMDTETQFGIFNLGNYSSNCQESVPGSFYELP